MKNIIYISSVLLVFTSCRKTEFDPLERTTGDADFTTYVAVGNSLTQGFQDGGVYEEGQSTSYPSIIAQQMSIVEEDMDDFDQPEVNGNGSGYMHLEWIDEEIEVINAGDAGGYAEDSYWSSWSPQGVKYNNLGISGISLRQCVALSETDHIVNNGILGGISFPPLFEQDGNPFARFLDFGSSPASLLGGSPGDDVQYLDHIKQSGATFFTNWLGNNDVLGYATSGGVPAEFDLSLIGGGVYDFNGLTDPIEFRQKYDSVLTAFHNMGAQGVCATIPDVTTIPFFNQFLVEEVKDEYGYSDLWIETGLGVVRVATSDDLILLSASEDIENGKGESSSNYLTNDLILDADEVATCAARTTELNNAIKSSAASFGYPVLDMFAYLNTLDPGITYEGIDFTVKYIEGGAFSLDGIHLNPRGYAIVANQFIKTINNTYGSNIPKVSIGNYRGVIFP